jgi:tRNA threonylcarbamoyladenosine biosynthesis protein TsaE
VKSRVWNAARGHIIIPMSDPDLIIPLPDAAATEALGARLAARLGPGDVICLYGALGAGKTTLARGAIRALVGPGTETPSPTYTLVQSYAAEGLEIVHADLYRLEREDDVLELGLEDAFLTSAVLVEWPERLGARLPRDRLDVHLEDAGQGGRRARLVGHGSWRERIGSL